MSHDYGVNCYDKKNFLRIVVNICILILSVLFFLFIAELICRSFNLTKKFNADFKFYVRAVDDEFDTEYIIEDFLLMWRLKPKYDDGVIKINCRGFRDKEYKIRKGKNIFRILCLGDSSTFGHNVPLPKTYHALLEDKLNEESKSEKKKFEVINAGVPGYTSAQGLNFYKYKGFTYNPNIVLFYFGLNDSIKRFYLDDKRIMQNKLPFVIKLMLNNYLIRLSSYRLFRKFVATTLDTVRKGKKENIPRVSLDDFKNNIIELNQLCKKRHSLLVLISPPFCKEKGLNWERGESVILYRKNLEDLAMQQKIPLIQIREMTEKSDSATGLFFIDPVHPNILGHKIIMQKIYNFMVATSIIINKNLMLKIVQYRKWNSYV